MAQRTAEAYKQGYIVTKQEEVLASKNLLKSSLLIDSLTYEELVHHERNFIVVSKTNISFYPGDTLLLYRGEDSDALSNRETPRLKVNIDYIWEAEDIDNELLILQSRGTTFEKVWGTLYVKHLIDKQGHSKLTASQHLIGFAMEEEQIIS